jgi:hypothetical protein
MWKFSGYIRIHFNKKEEAPLLAALSPSDHSWEMLVKRIHIEDGVYLSSNQDDKARPGLDPVWWLEGFANVVVDSTGTAVLYPRSATSPKGQVSEPQ